MRLRRLRDPDVVAGLMLAAGGAAWLLGEPNLGCWYLGGAAVTALTALLARE